MIGTLGSFWWRSFLNVWWFWWQQSCCVVACAPILSYPAHTHTIQRWLNVPSRVKLVVVSFLVIIIMIMTRRRKEKNRRQGKKCALPVCVLVGNDGRQFLLFYLQLARSQRHHNFFSFGEGKTGPKSQDAHTHTHTHTHTHLDGEVVVWEEREDVKYYAPSARERG
jgi:ABC-type nickel/cobalt efflux system permease component RcnA